MPTLKKSGAPARKKTLNRFVFNGYFGQKSVNRFSVFLAGAQLHARHRNAQYEKVPSCGTARSYLARHHHIYPAYARGTDMKTCMYQLPRTRKNKGEGGTPPFDTRDQESPIVGTRRNRRGIARGGETKRQKYGHDIVKTAVVMPRLLRREKKNRFG